MIPYMKAHRINLIILLCLAILFSLSCKKWIIDYRNKWAGNYSFSWKKDYWKGYAWATTQQNSEGKIYYRPLKNFVKSITIHIADTIIFTVPISKNGEIHNKEDPKVDGYIESNTISFTAFTYGKPGDKYTVNGKRH